LSKGFYLGNYPVTQTQWDAVLESNPSKFKGQHHPVDQARGEDCQALCRAMGTGFRLPTEIGCRLVFTPF
jgi:formylglycine-generating enzyme required for sulfatase activity